MTSLSPRTINSPSNYSYAETAGFYVSNYFQLIDRSGGPPLFSVSSGNGTFDSPQTGTATYTLTPGAYEFGATTNLGDLAFTPGAGTASGAHAEHYDFNLAAVSAAPEPNVWALSIAGVAMMGGALRARRRRGAILAA